MGEIITLPSRFNRIAAILVWALSATLLGSALFAADAQLTPLYPSAVTLAFFAWAGLWRPCVRVADDGVTLQNTTHRVTVPWVALIHVDTRYALTLHTPSGKFAAWSAPAPGFFSATLAGRRSTRREAGAVGAPLRAGDLLGTESGEAALVVREQWRRRLDRGEIVTGMADEVAVRREWDALVIGVLAVGAAATLWAPAAT